MIIKFLISIGDSRDLSVDIASVNIDEFKTRVLLNFHFVVLPGFNLTPIVVRRPIFQIITSPYPVPS